MILKLLVDGGEMKPSPALSQKMGPLGINMGKIISEVNKATTDFGGMKVPVSLDINTKTKDFKVTVATPPTSSLLKKEFGLDKGSGQPDKIKMANISIEHVIKIAKAKQPDMLVNDFKAAVKNVLGSCVSLGLLVESKSPKEVIQEINQGKYDKEIKSQSSEPSQEKLSSLEAEFKQVKKKQEAIIKALEEKKAKEAEAAGVAAPGAVPGAPAATTAATPAPTAAKPEEKGKAKK